ncbi:MAG: replicative DNA helicase [Clostridia bacterium]|nr:replicative DNA helicase [Clostridia bacterium]
MAKNEKNVVKRYPNNVDAEKSMLACILLDPKIANVMIDKLVEDDFFDLKHKHVFKAMKSLHAASKSIDIVSVSEKLPSLGISSEDVDIDYIVEISDFVPSTSGYIGYYDILKKNTLLRGLLNVSKSIAENVYVSDNAEASLDHAQQLILDLAKNTGSTTLTPVSEIVPQVLTDIQDQSLNGKAKGLMTGFKNMDYHFNGLKRSDVVLLAARPGIGKTAFALNIAANIAKNPEYKGANILIFSLEMSAKQLVTRMMCNIGEMDNDKINRGEMGIDDYVKLRSASSTLFDSGIYIDQTASSNPVEIFSKCKQFKIEHSHLDLIIIDYLQLMDLPDDRKSESRQQEVAYMSRRIKLLAKDLDVPVILLSQLSRGAEQRHEKPQLHDLRDSGSIEQDADIVLFLYKEKGQDPQNEVIELIVAKYRNGKQGSLAFRWDGRYFKFEPLSEEALDKIVVYGKDGQATVVGREGAPQKQNTVSSARVSQAAQQAAQQAVQQSAPAPQYPSSDNASDDIINLDASGLSISEDPKPVKTEE